LITKLAFDIFDVDRAGKLETCECDALLRMVYDVDHLNDIEGPPSGIELLEEIDVNGGVRFSVSLTQLARCSRLARDCENNSPTRACLALPVLSLSWGALLITLWPFLDNSDTTTNHHQHPPHTVATTTRHPHLATNTTDHQHPLSLPTHTVVSTNHHHH
jgi:hypothetical protein